MKRRANGEGSISKGTDGRWHGYYTAGQLPDGRPDRRHFSRGSYRDAVAKMQQVQRQADDGRLPAAGKPVTVEHWLEYWLEHVARPKVAPGTMPSYESKMRRYVIPRIGRRQLTKLTAEEVEVEVYSWMLHELGLSETTVAQTHRILSRALTVAAKRRRIPRNPLHDLEDAPTPEEADTNVLTVDEVRSILAVLQDRRNAARWHLALALGLRQSEALGLEWDAVDLDRGVLEVRQDLERRPWRHGCGSEASCGRRRGADCPNRLEGGGLVLHGRTKSGQARLVSIPEQLVPLLRAHRRMQAEERLLAGPLHHADILRDERRRLTATTHELVFTTLTGRPVDPRRDWAEWRSILAEADVPQVRVHDARHTAGTVMLLQGVPLEVIAKVLGHSQLQVTQRYAHVVGALLRDASARVGNAFYGDAAGTTATTTATTAAPRKRRR